jgi:hypothetical protein
MNEPRIRIVDDGDEAVVVHVDGEALIHVNHDEHGWDGMLAVLAAVKDLANKLGITVADEQDVV